MFLALQLFALFGAVFAKTNPNTVSELDVNAYVGHWTQVYGSPTNTIFQGYGRCITADYGLMDNGYVSVLNTQIDGDGALDQIGGYAYYKNVSEPGKLTVHLDGVPTDSPYWVVKLGELRDGAYQYSIITTPSGISLWVLVRDYDEFFELYDKEVQDYLRENKYYYTAIDQDECNYITDFDALRVSTYVVGATYQTECQVAGLLRKSGFPEYSIGTMVCISKYESSYNCDAKNKNTDGSTDYGLMQINSYWWCSGDALSKYNGCGVSCTSLFNCQTNTNCAFIVWKQQGYNAWYGYKSHKTECDNYKVNC